MSEQSTRLLKLPDDALQAMLHTDAKSATMFTTPIELIPPHAHATLRFNDGRAAMKVTKTVFIIGRGSVCDLVIDGDDSISRQHAAILFSDGAFFVEDLESTNGTSVGSHRVWRVPLREAVPVKVGNTTLTLHVDL